MASQCSQAKVFLLGFVSLLVICADNMPGFNFAYHCTSPLSADYPSLLRCPNIEKGIISCQSKGKQVVMSLGGASGTYLLKDKGQAKLFALRVWDLVLGGTGLKHLRPFGRAILDGVDLDIEGGSPNFYSDFVIELRKLMKVDSGRKYIVAAAPQCPFPDAYLGPSQGRALGDVPQLFDEIYIQYYNNYCHAGNPNAFWSNVQNWLRSFANNNGPLVLIGLPGDSNGASNSAANYQSPTHVKAIFDKLKSNPGFGGFMIWDAGFDEHNKINGRMYSDHIVAIMNNGVVVPIATTPVAILTTNAAQTQTVPKTIAATSAPPTAKPTSLSCAGIPNGHYPHPSETGKFLVCYGGKLYVKSCVPGLKWNQAKKTCDWPWNVKS